MDYTPFSMKLEEELQKEFSKYQVMKIAEMIGPDQEAFDDLIKIFLGENKQLSPRAAWVLSHSCDEYPWLIEKHIDSVISNLQNDVNDAVKRNSLRVLRYVEVPEDLAGTFADLCFKFL